MKRITLELTVDLVPAQWQDLMNTGLVGYLDATYAEIAAELGAPERFDERGNKVDAQWRLKDAGGKLGVFSVYNYKDGPNYLGRDGTPVEAITEWHIGGRVGTSLAMVQAIFGERVRAA